jgi:hypothetical protein
VDHYIRIHFSFDVAHNLSIMHQSNNLPTTDALDLRKSAFVNLATLISGGGGGHLDCMLDDVFWPPLEQGTKKAAPIHGPVLEKGILASTRQSRARNCGEKRIVRHPRTLLYTVGDGTAFSPTDPATDRRRRQSGDFIIEMRAHWTCC